MHLGIDFVTIALAMKPLWRTCAAPPNHIVCNVFSCSDGFPIVSQSPQPPSASLRSSGDSSLDSLPSISSKPVLQRKDPPISNGSFTATRLHCIAKTADGVDGGEFHILKQFQESSPCKVNQNGKILRLIFQTETPRLLNMIANAFL